MSLDRLWLSVAVLAALSVASERLVEIVKGFLPGLQKRPPSAGARGLREPVRRALVHLLAVACSVLMAKLAAPAIPGEILSTPEDPLGVLALGLLASGGSGFWNSILGYLEGVKNLRREIGELQTSAPRRSPGDPPAPSPTSVPS